MNTNGKMMNLASLSRERFTYCISWSLQLGMGSANLPCREPFTAVVFNLFRSAAHFQPGGLAAAHQCLQVFF